MMKYFSLLIFIFICLSIGLLGGLSTYKSVRTWYKTIKKPSWNPPDRIFAPVWTTLYLIMAISAWLVWERLPHYGSYAPMSLFAIQLILNFIWSPLFFGMRRPDLALIEILFLWVFIILTIKSFWSVYWLAGAMLLPYLCWVTFAIILNATIWWLNKKET